MAISYDNGSSASSLTVAHTIGSSGNDRLLVAFYHGSSSSVLGATMASCTYNSVSADGSFSIGDLKWGNAYVITCFYWRESSLPSNGTPTSYNCVATTNAGVWNYAGIVQSFTGVDQSGSIVTASDHDTAGNTGQSDIDISTAVSDSIIVDSSGWWGGSSNSNTMTTASGQTKVVEVSQNAQGDLASGYEIVSSAGSNTQSWTFNNEYSWAACAIAIGPSGGAVTPQYNMLGHNF
jgi:hypothetical protein